MTERVRLVLLVVILCAAAPGCSDLGVSPRLRPVAELSASMLDFGTVAVSDSARRSVTIRNVGNAALVGHAALSCSEYELVSGGGPFTVPPGGSIVIEVRFQPSAVGSFPCTLDLGADHPRVAVAGVGAFQAMGARSAVLPDSIDFGTVKSGESKQSTFKVFSVGTAPLLVNIVSACADFAVLAGGGPATIAPGEFVTVTIQFTPQSGARHECAITVGPACPDVIVSGFATTVSFASHVQPIFQAWCEGCHSFGDPTFGYGILTQSPSAYPPGRMVIPFDLTNSVLYGKITNSGQFGPLMPQGGPLLPQEDRDVIRQWILEGARNN